MNEHLSSEQVSEWILGRRTPEGERHVRECAECNAELARCQSALAAFGQSVRGWAERQEASPGPEVWVTASQTLPVQPWRLAAVLAAVVIAAGIPIYESAMDARREARLQEEQEDSQLLDHVNVQLSRMVPASMEPLLELMQEEGKETSQ